MSNKRGPSSVSPLSHCKNTASPNDAPTRTTKDQHSIELILRASDVTISVGLELDFGYATTTANVPVAFPPVAVVVIVRYLALESVFGLRSCSVTLTVSVLIGTKLVYVDVLYAHEDESWSNPGVQLGVSGQVLVAAGIF